MYKCRDCGGIFEEPRTWSEAVGTYMGSPAMMDFSESPCCGAAYEEVKTDCEECALWGKTCDTPDNGDYCECFEQRTEEMEE